MQLVGMTTYILSQHKTVWKVHCYSGIFAGTLVGAGTEEEATILALRKSEAIRPSQVLRISLDGESSVIAKFEEIRRDKRKGISHGAVPGGVEAKNSQPASLL